MIHETGYGPYEPPGSPSEVILAETLTINRNRTVYTKNTTRKNHTRVTRWRHAGGTPVPRCTHVTRNRTFYGPDGSPLSQEAHDATLLYALYVHGTDTRPTLMSLYDFRETGDISKVAHHAPLLLNALNEKRTLDIPEDEHAFNNYNTGYRFTWLPNQTSWCRFFVTAPGIVYAGLYDEDKTQWVTSNPTVPDPALQAPTLDLHDTLTEETQPANLLDHPNLIREMFANEWLTPDTPQADLFRRYGHEDQIELGMFTIQMTS